MVDCIKGAQSPCQTVVLSQTSLDPAARERVWRRKHHLPEPWVGHLEEAPILFLSSNPFLVRDYNDQSVEPPPAPLRELHGKTIDQHPSLGRPFEAPRADWDDAQLIDKFESLFDVWTDEPGTRLYDETGGLGPKSRYWVAASTVASQVLNRRAVPGTHYALTEVVRCKSPKEKGVGTAVKECVPQYLKKTLVLSPARLLVVMGRSARLVIRRLTQYAEFGPISPPLTIAGIDRIVVFLAHPSSSKSKYEKTLNDEQVAEIRMKLAELDRSPRYTWEADDVTITKEAPRTSPQGRIE